MSRMKSLLSPFCTIEIYHPWRSVSPYLPLHGAKKKVDNWIFPFSKCPLAQFMYMFSFPVFIILDSVC